jgi:hypothetical protein
MLQLLEQQTPFDVRLELDGVGALDDVVLTLWDAARTKQLGQLFLRLKHANDDDATHLRWKDFVNKSGHFEVQKYFDDWCLFLCSGRMPAAVAPAAPTAVPRNCVYYTNRDFEQSVPCLAADGTRGLRFTDAFLNGAASSQSDFAKLLAAIKEHSFVCNPALLKKKNKKGKIVDDNNQSNPIKNSAREWYQSGTRALDDAQLQHCLRVFLHEHFRLRVGEPGVDELQPKVREQVAAYFPDAADVDAIFHALLHSACAWFRELGVATTCQIFLSSRRVYLLCFSVRESQKRRISVPAPDSVGLLVSFARLSRTGVPVCYSWPHGPHGHVAEVSQGREGRWQAH